MLKKVTISLAVVMVLLIGAAIFVTVWFKNNPRDLPPQDKTQITERLTVAEEPATAAEENSSTAERQTVQEEATRLNVTFETTVPFKAKKTERNFKGQNDRIKLYKKVFAQLFDEKSVDVFLYDITHDGLCDMVTVTPMKENNKQIGVIVQLFTVTENGKVTEIFRDYGSSDGLCCYVTERDGEDCLFISKDEMVGGAGELSYNVFYVDEDGTVITQASSSYSSESGMDYDSDDNFNSYSKNFEMQLSKAHTTLYDYRKPSAVKSNASDVFGKYIK